MALIKRTGSDQPPLDHPIEEPVLDAAHLAAELSSTDASVRRQAARSLSAMPETSDLLCAHLQDEPNLSVRSIIFSGLISHPSEAVVHALMPLLRSEDVNLRNGAIEALQEMPSEVMPFMETALTDADSDARIMAVNILCALQHSAAPARLLRVVAEDPHVNVCMAALDGLAEVGEEEAIPVLEGLALRFPDVTFVRFAVNAAVRRIRGG